MDKNVNIILENMLQLIKEEEDEYKRIDSALTLNPSLTWIKFILTDDKPNGNKFRIDKNAFSELIKSGIYMPIKMADGRISDGHDGTTPIGVITDLIVDDNKIKGIGVLWGEERPEEVAMLKQLKEEGKPVNISWEILYKDYEEEDGGIRAIKNGAVLLAATIVGRPAYAGRTPVLEVANKNTKEDDKVEELEKFKKLYEEALAEKEMSSKELESYKLQIQDFEKKFSELESELNELRSYKEQREKEDAENKRFEEIKSKFIEAGIEVGPDYFNDKRDYLLSMSEEVLDFFIKELVVFKATETASLKQPKVPNITKKPEDTILSPAEIAKRLKEELNKER